MAVAIRSLTGGWTAARYCAGMWLENLQIVFEAFRSVGSSDVDGANRGWRLQE